MSSGVVSIICAIIAGSGLPIWFLNRFDKRNTDQHNSNLQLLNEIKQDINIVKDDARQVRFQLGRHLEWHLTGEQNNGTKGTNTTVTRRRKMRSRETSQNVTD